MAAEIKEIPGFPGYGADAKGGIWSRLTRGGRGQRKPTAPWRLLKPSLRAGYPCVWLHPVGGRRAQEYVHRLILLTFVGPCPEGCETLHLNDLKTDNRLENLKWGTPSENQQQRWRKSGSKLTADAVRWLRANPDADSLAGHACRFNVTKGMICNILHGHARTNVKQEDA